MYSELRRTHVHETAGGHLNNHTAQGPDIRTLIVPVLPVKGKLYKIISPL